MSDAEWVKAFLSMFTTALGVLLGLLGNNYVNWRREDKAYRSMLKAIAIEGKSNQIILKKSFLKYYRDGVVLRQFSTVTVVRCIGDSIFSKCASNDELEVIYEYVRNIYLANTYREKIESIQFGHIDARSDQWINNIVVMWEENLNQCELSIDKIVRIHPAGIDKRVKKGMRDCTGGAKG